MHLHTHRMQQTRFEKRLNAFNANGPFMTERTERDWAVYGQKGQKIGTCGDDLFLFLGGG